MKNLITPTKKKIYSKQNSVIDLNIGTDVEIKEILQRIIKLSNNQNVLSRLSDYELEILQKVFSDLFENSKNSSSLRYQISKYAIGEILSNINTEEKLSKYLFHRYRYEMFPQQYLLDDYPPYLQIEPTSYCNYRCLFLYSYRQDFYQKVKRLYGPYEC